MYKLKHTSVRSRIYSAVTRGAVAFVVSNERDVSVLSLHDGATGDVTVQVGGQAIELRAGEQLVIASSTSPSFGDVNPLPGIACRDLKEYTLATGHRAFICQFSLSSALGNLSALKQLAQSSQSRDRDIHAKILKNAAILHMVTAATDHTRSGASASFLPELSDPNIVEVMVHIESGVPAEAGGLVAIRLSTRSRSTTSRQAGGFSPKTDA